MNNKLPVNPNFDMNNMNKQNQDDMQRNNSMGVNFLPNLSVPMVGYPVYTQGYPPNVTFIISFC